MKRSEKECPDNIIEPNCFGGFLTMAWKKGWLDDFSDDHFLIKAIENRLTDFVGKDQLIENNSNQYNIVQDGKVNRNLFCSVFCFNLSIKLDVLSKRFNEKEIEHFVKHQLSAGKEKYNEDVFFEALSEISILCFMCRHEWTALEYEPQLNHQNPKKNPEARFTYESKNDHIFVNVEVKSPAFPHNNHKGEKIIIPTILLSEEGIGKVQDYCSDHNLIFIRPRILKIRDFLNSAQSKFVKPKKDEFNFLYINWSYSDFPSYSFLEAWALMTNSINGILTNPIYAKHIGVKEEVFDKISAVIVYTESIEGIVFQSFQHVWQGNKDGPRFRMWVNPLMFDCSCEYEYLKRIFEITGMNKTNYLDQMLMGDFKQYDFYSKCDAEKMANELHDIIQSNALVLK